MNWFAYVSLVTLSAFVLANALAFERAAKEWAKDLSGALKNTPLNPTDSGLEFPPTRIQEALGPPCVTVWFWLGILSVIGSIVAGGICLGWHALIAGVIVAGISARMARGIWPQPSSRMYFAAFYECLGWRLRNYKQRGDMERARWVAYLMAAMEQTEELAKDLSERPRTEAEHDD